MMREVRKPVLPLITIGRKEKEMSAFTRRWLVIFEGEKRIVLFNHPVIYFDGEASSDFLISYI